MLSQIVLAGAALLTLVLILEHEDFKDLRSKR